MAVAVSRVKSNLKRGGEKEAAGQLAPVGSVCLSAWQKSPSGVQDAQRPPPVVEGIAVMRYRAPGLIRCAPAPVADAGRVPWPPTIYNRTETEDRSRCNDVQQAAQSSLTNTDRHALPPLRRCRCPPRRSVSTRQSSRWRQALPVGAL